MATGPTGIHAIRAQCVVEITWAPDHVGRYSNWLLRTSCTCAACVDEFTGRPILDPATIPQDIAITSMQLVGNYAVRFSYSDGHDTGIATWERLLSMCPCERCRNR